MSCNRTGCRTPSSRNARYPRSRANYNFATLRVKVRAIYQVIYEHWNELARR